MKKTLLILSLLISMSSFATGTFTISDTQFLYSLTEKQAIRLAEANVWERAFKECKTDLDKRIALRETEPVIDTTGLQQINGVSVTISFTCY